MHQLLTLPTMLLLRLLPTVALVAALSVQAAPSSAPGAQEDELQQFMADKGLMDKLGQVRTRIAETTSELVVTAMGFLGVPYRRGGNSAETGGFDCSGFVKAIYEQTVGLVLPRRAEQQAAATQAVDRHDLQPGDLVFFNTMKRAFSHVGIYVGDGKFIHSPKPGAEVRVENLSANYWQRRFNGARRVLPGQQTAAQAIDIPGSQP